MNIYRVRKFLEHHSWPYAVIVLLLLVGCVLAFRARMHASVGTGPADMEKPETTGLHVEKIEKISDDLVFSLVSVKQETWQYSDVYHLDCRKNGEWMWICALPEGPSPDVALLIHPGQTVEYRISWSYLQTYARDEHWPDGLYRVRYYDGIYEFELN